MRVLPVVLSLATLGVMSAAVLSGSGATRSPMFLAFPVTMLVSLVMTAVTGRGNGGAPGSTPTVPTTWVTSLTYANQSRKTWRRSVYR